MVSGHEDSADTSGAAVFTVHPAAYFTWQQHRPGGCRCLCLFFHPGTESPANTCLSAAEPGLLIRVEADGHREGPLPVCRDCYTGIAADSATTCEGNP